VLRASSRRSRSSRARSGSYYPGRVGSAAVVVALISAAIGGFQRNLATFAVAFTGICWFAGMVIAISLERAVF